jgi:hypothetical protein
MVDGATGSSGADKSSPSDAAKVQEKFDSYFGKKLWSQWEENRKEPEWIKSLKSEE